MLERCRNRVWGSTCVGKLRLECYFPAVVPPNITHPHLLSVSESICSVKQRHEAAPYFWAAVRPPQANHTIGQEREWKRKPASERSKAIHFPNFWALVTCYTEIPAMNHDQSAFSCKKMKFEPCWIFHYLLTSGVFNSPFLLAFSNWAGGEKKP